MDASRSIAAGARDDRPWPSERLRSWIVAAVYLALSVGYTWPLARGLDKDVPADLGDSLLNMWILSWEVHQIRLLFSGDFSVLGRWFDGNIFYPAPDTLAYSEHLIAQSIQILPVHLLTGNPILCYNLLFLSTYVLSGLGTYLLVRELTGDRRAAFVAGLLFAFIPYRLAQASHLQVLSSQWMPFTLYGFTRYLNTGHRRALVGAATALSLQCLSCGYYLIYFAPFAAGYVLWEVLCRGRQREPALWRDLVVAALGVGATLTPFLIPYARAQASVQLARSMAEVSSFSADVYAYVTAFPTQRLWGPLLDVMRRPEGELFMGAIPSMLWILGVVLWLHSMWQSVGDSNDRFKRLSTVFGVATILLAALLIAAVFLRRFSIGVDPFSVRVTDIGRLMLWLGVSAAVWLVLSGRARSAVRAGATSRGFFLVASVIAWWLSLGPTPHAMGLSLDLPAPYRLLYALPGVNGVRVPARLAMVVALMLAVSGGYVLARFRGRTSTLLAGALSLAFLFEASASEFSVNGNSATAEHAAPEARVHLPADAPGVYPTVAALPADTVLLELPLGDTNWDVRSVYYASSHWHPVVNGYSGFFPPHYGALQAALADPSRQPAEAWRGMNRSGATHVVLHERAYRRDGSAAVQRWLTESGAREVARRDGDVLYEVHP